MRKQIVIFVFLLSLFLLACGHAEPPEKKLISDFVAKYNATVTERNAGSTIRSARYWITEKGLPYFVLELKNKDIVPTIFLNKSKKDIVMASVRFDPLEKEEALAAFDYLFLVLALYTERTYPEIMDALLPVVNDDKEMAIYSDKMNRFYHIRKERQEGSDFIAIIAVDKTGKKLYSMSSKELREITHD